MSTGSSAEGSFAQALNADRPHTLLTSNPKRSGTLAYRYDDTGEVVRVPNIWYNQTFQTRVATIRWDAQVLDDQAAMFEQHPPLGMSVVAAADIAGRLRLKAAQRRAQADVIELAGNPAYPVLASVA